MIKWNWKIVEKIEEPFFLNYLCFWKFSTQNHCASLGPQVQDLPRSRETVSLHGCQIVGTYRAYINHMENQMEIMESWKQQKNNMKQHQGTSFQWVFMDFKDDFENGDAGRRSNLEEISSQLISTAVRLLRRCVYIMCTLNWAKPGPSMVDWTLGWSSCFPGKQRVVWRCLKDHSLELYDYLWQWFVN